MTAIIVVIYALLIIVFLVVSAFILRYTLKFSYLSPRFRKVVTIFAIIALATIIYSIFLVFNLTHGTSVNVSIPSSGNPTSGINF